VAGFGPVIALVRSEQAWHAMSWTAELDDVELLQGTVTEPDAWTSSARLERLSGVVHLAALVRHSRHRASEVYQTNVEGTIGVARLAAARRCRLLFVSTSGTVGCFDEPGVAAAEEAPYCEEQVAGWPYYRSKILAERATRALVDDLGLDLVIVRPPVVLGPGDHKFRSTGHLLRFLEGRLPFLVRGGIHFADVRDVADGLLHALQRPDAQPIYNLPGTACEIREFFAMAERLSGVPAPRRILSARVAWWLAALLRPMRIFPDPVVVEVASHYWNTTSRYAVHDLRYANRPPRETLKDTIEWLRANHPALHRGERLKRSA